MQFGTRPDSGFSTSSSPRGSSGSGPDKGLGVLLDRGPEGQARQGRAVHGLEPTAADRASADLCGRRRRLSGRTRRRVPGAGGAPRARLVDRRGDGAPLRAGLALGAGTRTRSGGGSRARASSPPPIVRCCARWPPGASARRRAVTGRRRGSSPTGRCWRSRAGDRDHGSSSPTSAGCRSACASRIWRACSRAIAEGAAAEPIHLPPAPPAELQARMDTLGPLGQILVIARAAEAEVAPSLVATRDEIETFLWGELGARDAPTHRLRPAGDSSSPGRSAARPCRGADRAGARRDAAVPAADPPRPGSARPRTHRAMTALNAQGPVERTRAVIDMGSNSFRLVDLPVRPGTMVPPRR